VATVSVESLELVEVSAGTLIGGVGGGLGSVVFVGGSGSGVSFCLQVNVVWSNV
jgi:hypothetical protein